MKIICISWALAALVLATGCASGPTPVELARRDEVRSNAPGVPLSAEEIARANELLRSLNAAAGPYLQEDSNNLMFGPMETEDGASFSTWFLLDDPTGRLTFKSFAGAREFMLRHVMNVTTHLYEWGIRGVDRSTFVDARGIPFAAPGRADTGTRYDVHLYTNGRVILTNPGGRAGWKRSIVVLANDAAAAEAIEASLKELVAIYR